ncbi:response regulator [Aestuariivita boseongensis]|uniref:response regulator n=1 Tax=Aestuariivita boseongensis TaxID=1470562 RepID=UPI000680577C|nr:response regulator [Aestuariivita boseongensis]
MVVVQYTSGEEALSKVAEAKPDLLLLDVMMPDVDGFSLLKRIRKLQGFSQICAVFLTAKADSVSAENRCEPGVLDVLMKPFDTLELPQIIQQLYREHQDKTVGRQ